LNILIQTKDHAACQELREFTESCGNEVFLSGSPRESIRIMGKNKIDQIVVSLKGFNDAAILQYINDYCPDTEVVVLTSEGFSNMLSLFRNSKYSVIYEPLTLEKLMNKIPRGKNLA
jgi:DNA-binding NtrC family response regulator